MTKNIVLLLFLAVIIIGCNTGTKNIETDNNESEISQKEGLYGDQINTANPISGTELVKMLEEKDSVWVTMESTIVSNCKKSGCWMDLDLENGEVIKVTFKDYAFFIPLESEGKKATIEGFAKKEVIPVDMLRHYAEDDGKSQEEIDAIKEPQLAYTFEAKGVVIED